MGLFCGILPEVMTQSGSLRMNISKVGIKTEGKQGREDKRTKERIVDCGCGCAEELEQRENLSFGSVGVSILC